MFFGVFGLAIHVVFLFSIFDIYFKSPLIHGMTPHSTPSSPPSRRVALFVADGLRADKLFEVDETGQTKSPFLREIVTNVGAWGISHTRVPTESRPGHVAIAAGIYEDVSAVAKGWKENPVDFDSVFNESRYTWAWGSPDILPMFSKGTKRQHIFIDTYSASDEDFGGANPSNLDTWVFNKFESFLSEAKRNTTVMRMLSQDKIIFFFHLLGLDTSGHAYKPGSHEYVKNIEIVDSGIEKCMKIIDDFFENDEKTSYIVTSDHGMTDWGSHGAGHPHETYTPLIAWGAGIRGPLGEGKDVYHDGLSEEWKLAQTKRVDVNQVDIAPLIAALLGIPFPVNSLGVLPVEYLGSEWPHKALSLLTNARQILAQYQLKMRKKQESTLPFFFWPYRDLSPTRQAELMLMIETLLTQNRYGDSIQVGLKLIELASKGLVYYQKYDRFALSLSMFFGFVGWMSYVIVLILKDYTIIESSSLESSVSSSNDDMYSIKITLAYGVVSVFITLLLYVQDSPSMYYIYFLIPVVLWALVSMKWHLFQQAKQHIEKKNCLMQFISFSFIGFIALELLVMSFFRRELLSIVLWGVAFWPFFTPLKTTHKTLSALWLLASIALSIFPFLPVVGRDSNYNLVVLAGWLFVLGISYCARRPETGLILNNRESKKEPQQVVFITAVQVIILCFATYNVRSVSYSLIEREGLPLTNQIVSWLILGVSFILPVFGSSALLTRLLNVITSIISPYLLLSISHEGLFCLCLSILMFLWLFMEHNLSYNYSRLQDLSFNMNTALVQRKYGTSKMNLDDLRRAYFFMFFTLLAFFGTGNIASLNSFEPSSVYCFITVFNPFVMGFLMLLKVIIPFMIVSCFFRAIVITLKASPKSLFLLILLMSDFVGLHFFFLVQDSGSWLEIGTSISHYVISMTITIFIMLLYGLAKLLTSFSLTLSLLRRKWHTQ